LLIIKKLYQWNKLTGFMTNTYGIDTSLFKISFIICNQNRHLSTFILATMDEHEYSISLYRCNQITVLPHALYFSLQQKLFVVSHFQNLQLDRYLRIFLNGLSIFHSDQFLLWRQRSNLYFSN